MSDHKQASVEKLRSKANLERSRFGAFDPMAANLTLAADELERLRGEREEMRGTLEELKRVAADEYLPDENKCRLVVQISDQALLQPNDPKDES